jgi:sodium/potassium-transporting ATPase subunit alpha
MVPAISLAYEGREANIMSKPPRDARTDRLVTAKLVCFSYLQVGVVQAAAGFYAYVIVLKDFGFAPSMLPGIGWSFERETWHCLLPKAYQANMSTGPIDPKAFTCEGGFALSLRETKNQWKAGGKFSVNSKKAVVYTGGFNAADSKKVGYHMWARHNKLDKHKNWKYIGEMSNCWVSNGDAPDPVCWNAAEALLYAQTAFFLSIIVVQWSDILACKTRTLSLKNQGMRNNFLSFGLFFETTLGALLCYVPFLQDALFTRPIYFVHWCAPMPFAIFILSYDELRKLLMRNLTGDLKYSNFGKGWLKTPEEGDQPTNWVFKNTYY